MQIAIQGFEGCFHQIAAQHYFGQDAGMLSCATFGELIRKVKSGEAGGGVMAIENSIAGSILPNYNLLQKSGLCVTGEIFLKIRQHLMVLPGQTLDDIREVHSHPMALLQCMTFLEKHAQWRLVETEDTALSARHLRQRRATHTAAIASKLAADLFDLEIVAPNIHTEKKNYTRFLVLRKTEDAVKEDHPDKSSVYFHTANTHGSLARVLSRIADEGVNLSKLQSFPIPGSEWKYYFHADMEFQSLDQFEKVVRAIRPMTESMQILGIYKKGVTV
ncbi:prephenate dehydratase [Compostibacter hankyongensis]|uniref:prephenate dehydratase n=1 Tax=Compostibacter hankyongensis TaxID=1007089 RepID=A0ABP8FVI0_9BACT